MARQEREGLLEVGDGLVLYGTAAIAGAAVMMLELLGTRIIGPFYGVNLFAWSALISVTLIALALGYYLGGCLADRTRRFRLSHGIALAALFTALIPLASRPVLSLTNGLGMRWGAFVSALLLFTVPLAFLGMVGPQVIKLAARRLEGVGTISGSVYAISTGGSVAGTLLLGFFLLPEVGARLVLYGVSAALIALAAGVAVYERRRLDLPSSLGMVLLAGGLGGAALFAWAGAGPALSGDLVLLHEAESLYGRVRVIDDHARKVRWMLSDASIISAMRLDNGKSPLLYQRILETLPHFHPQGRKALLIGLGGGQIAQALEKMGMVTDAVEIDPEVAHAARAYFGFEPPGRLLVGDARYEILRLEERYDFIIHDCFTGGAVPAHLLSVEMLRHLRRLLNERGILALNFVGFAQGREAQAAEAVYRTLGEVFAHRRVLVSLPGEDFNDFVFLASAAPLEIDAGQGPVAPGGQTPLAEWLEARELQGLQEHGFAITDDFNPLERLQARKAEVYRALLVQRLGMASLAW
jgi:spermidine synthase